MRIYTGPTTPFGRMVEIVALEAGVTLEREVIHVYEAAFLEAENPLRLIPTLVGTPHGTLHDSRVICRYLAGLAPDRGFLPPETDWRFETRLALIAGIMDAGVARQGEVSRASGSSETKIAVFDRRIRLGLAALEREFDVVSQSWPRLDAIGTAVLLEYLNFRIGPEWRAEAPRLSDWLDARNEMASMQATRFTAAQPTSSTQRRTR
ncbi:glutathione S-transferase family protein [Aureimonas sp. AU12]|uniref:glutathione S-transferase family protein n=1 Tax=Aureimonas sp. AU12 TaxID=1638161 RepID=UPI0012E333DF|nr:glutathione S-transferase family protein [Aureimonas sp. AU12]